jgi:hypothetical protein
MRGRALALALAALAACTPPTRIAVQSVDRLRVVGVAGPRARVEVELSIQTNAPLDSTVTVLAYELAFGSDPPLARGGRLAPLKVPAGGVVTIVLPAELALRDLPADLPAQAASGALPYRARVWIEADTALGVSQHRLEPSGRAPLAETFAAVVDGVFAEDSARVVDVELPRLEGADVALHLDLEFPGHLPFPVQVRQARYRVWLGDTYIGEGESAEGFRVLPGSGGRGRFALRVPAERVPGLAGRLLVGQPEARIEGEVEIDPIGPLRSVPFRARRRVR